MLLGTEMYNKSFEADDFLIKGKNLHIARATSSASMEGQDIPPDLMSCEPLINDWLSYEQATIDFNVLCNSDFSYGDNTESTGSCFTCYSPGSSTVGSLSTSAASSPGPSTLASPSISAANSPEHPYGIGTFPPNEYFGMLDNDVNLYEDYRNLDKYLHSDDADYNLFNVNCIKSENDPFIGNGDVMLSSRSLTNTTVSAPGDKLNNVDEDELGQVFLPLASLSHLPVSDSIEQTNCSRTMITLSASSYTINFDHCYNKPHSEAVVPIKIEIKSEPEDEEDDSESSDSSDDDDDCVMPTPNKDLRAEEEEKYQVRAHDTYIMHDKVDRVEMEAMSSDSCGSVQHKDGYSEIKCQRMSTSTRVLRPIVKPKRFSQRENTPPVRQYKKDFNKKEVTKAATAMLKQTRQNQGNPKNVRARRRGRRPANSLSSSPSSSRSNSDMEEPVLKRNMHNNMERLRRNLQRTALHNLRDKIPHLKDNPKVSKVKIITAAQEYIEELQRDDGGIVDELERLRRRNVMLMQRFRRSRY